MHSYTCMMGQMNVFNFQCQTLVCIRSRKIHICILKFKDLVIQFWVYIIIAKCILRVEILLANTYCLNK